MRLSLLETIPVASVILYFCFVGYGCGNAAPNADRKSSDSNIEPKNSDSSTEPASTEDVDSSTGTSLDTATMTDDSESAGPPCVHPEVVMDCEAGWCRIPPGCFTAGSPVDEMGHGVASEIQNQITLTHAFEIQQYEVTQGQWTAAGFPDPSAFGSNGNGLCASSDCPVDKINWYEAVAFANRMSETHVPPLPVCYSLKNCTGEIGSGMICESVSVNSSTIYECEGYRLPTMYEAEYTTRAGTQTAFYSGDITNYEIFAECEEDKNLEKNAWFCRNAEERTHPVGQKEPNGWGLYDMAGNVAEWEDSQVNGRSTAPEPVTDPVGPSDVPNRRALRGGYYLVPAVSCRAAYTLDMPPDQTVFSSGTRLARTLK